MTAATRGLRAIGGTAAACRLALLGLLLMYFSLALPDFLGLRNFYALFQSFAVLGLVTLGLSLTMIVGEFDLSVGAMVAVAGLITLKTGGETLWPGVGYALLFALCVGLFNALVFSWLNLSSLVITVGTMMVLSGMAVWLADGRVISTDNFDLGEALDMTVLGVFSWRSLMTLAAFPLVFLLLRFTRLGRDIVATGSHTAAARASGVPVRLAYCTAFVLSAVLAALAGSLLSISLATASASMGGNLLLQAASAAIIGGVALSGGIGRISGILTGLMILTVLTNGLSLMGASAAVILFTNGAVLLLVVLVDGRLGRFLRQGWRRRRSQVMTAARTSTS